MLLATLAFTFADPAGDALGNGTLTLPQRPPIQAEALDLREFQAAGNPLSFRVSFGAVQNPWKLPSGFSAGVTDIFVKTGLGGLTSLDHLGLNVPGGWEYHVRVSGAEATLERATEDGKITPLAAPKVTLEGTTLNIQTAIPGGQYGYWVTSSVYSPLSADGLLRPTLQSDSASPGALGSPFPDAPVPVDVLAAPGDNSAYTTHLFNPVGQSKDMRPLILLSGGLASLLLTVLATFWLNRSVPRASAGPGGGRSTGGRSSVGIRPGPSGSLK